MPNKKTATSRLYELRVGLQEIKPPIWRTFRVPGNIKLFQLHNVLQVIMGWTNSHLHQFEKDGKVYGRPADFERDESPPTDDKKAKLEGVLQKVGDLMVYTYDFGDYWQHDVVLERILFSDQPNKPPVCLDGARHCPPEDVGGVSGYENFLEAIFDSSHEEHQGMLEWAGGYFQPEEFDAAEINATLAGKRRGQVQPKH